MSELLTIWTNKKLLIINIHMDLFNRQENPFLFTYNYYIIKRKNSIVLLTLLSFGKHNWVKFFLKEGVQILWKLRIAS